MRAYQNAIDTHTTTNGGNKLAAGSDTKYAGTKYRQLDDTCQIGITIPC